MENRRRPVRLTALAALFLAAVLATTACTPSAAPAPPSPEASEDPLAGFISYENEGTGLRFLHPGDWLFGDLQEGESTEDQFARLQAAGIDTDYATPVLLTPLTALYNTEDMVEGRAPSMLVMAQPFDYIDDAHFTNPIVISQVKGMIEDNVSAFAPDFSWGTPPKKQRFGDRDFVYMAADCTLSGVPSTMHLAALLRQGTLYAFSYTGPAGSDAEAFLTTLSTVAFAE